MRDSNAACRAGETLLVFVRHAGFKAGKAGEDWVKLIRCPRCREMMVWNDSEHTEDDYCEECVTERLYTEGSCSD